MRGRAILRTAAVVVLVSLLACASAAGRIDGMGAAKSFHKFPVYWAGEEVAGFPLEDISAGSNGFTFFYGSCELAGTDHPSCAPPIEIQLFSICERWATPDKVKSLIPFRGAQASWYPGLPVKGLGLVERGPLEIFTGRETVVIYIEEADLMHRSETQKVAFTVGRALRTVHQTEPGRLSPPAKGSLGGKLPCQNRPGKPLK
jgi:hypothetical protein